MKIDDIPAHEMTLREHYAELIAASTVAKFGCDWDAEQHTEYGLRIATRLCRELAKPRPIETDDHPEQLPTEPLP